MQVNEETVGRSVLDTARKYCGRNVDINDRVVGDLQITRGDAVEFYNEIERAFNVDLRPITETTIRRGKPRIWREAITQAPLDPTIMEIVAFVVANSNGLS